MVKSSASAAPSGVRACCRSSSLSLSNSRVIKAWLCMVCEPVRDNFTGNRIRNRRILDAGRAAVNQRHVGAEFIRHYVGLALLPATFLVLLSRTAGAGVVATYFLRSLQASSLSNRIAYGDERLGVWPIRVILLPFRALFLSPPDLFGAIEVEQVRSQIVEETRSPLPDHLHEFLEAAVHLLAD